MVTQVTTQDLEAHITGTISVKSLVRANGQNGKFTVNFVYFEPSSADLLVPTDVGGTYKIPLKMNNYGFPDSRVVRVDRRGRVNGLSPLPADKYHRMLDRQEVPLSEALEIIARVVNESMEYDTEGLISGRYGELPTQELLQKISASGYTPHGQETIKGICGDAGELIRTLIGCTLRDDSLNYLCISSKSKSGDGHDTTLVFDPATENWAVVNSKSPLKPYNLVPREKLSELGIPFA